MTNSADNNDTNAVAPDTVSIESTNDAGVQSATMVQDVCNIATAEGIEGVVAPVVVDKPDANDPYSLLIEPGKEYFLDFEESEVANMSLDGDNLIITLDNGGVLTLIDFVDATNNPDLPATAAFRDPFALSDFAEMMPAVVDTVPDEAELEEPQAEIREEVAQIEPAAGDEPAAEQLAQIEPAAGDEGGAGGSRGGYGYQSSFDAQGIDGLDDVGPIDPTALQYGVNFNNEILFPPQQQTPVGPVDSQPVVNQPTSVLDETNFDTGGNVANGTIVVNFGNDGPGTIAPDGTFTINGSVPAGGLMSGGDSVVITQTANGYVGVTTGGVTVFELTIDPLTGDYTYTQYAPFDHADGTDPNDLITIDFGVVATDADGDSVNTTVQINVFDDAPVLDDDNLGTLSEDALDTGPVTLNGNLIEDGGEDSAAVITTNGNDFQASGSMAGGVLSSGGEAVSVTATADGYVGTLADGTVVFELTITNSATGEYTFTLYQALDHGAAGPDVITLDFGVLITDFDGDTDDATITINIEDGEPTIPGNDNPQIGEGLENVDETDLNGGTISQSGTLPVDFGNDGPGEVKGDGTFTIDGVTTLTSGGQPVDVTYDAATGTYTGTAGGQTIFTLTIDPVTGDYTFTLLGQIDHPDATDPNDVIQLQFGVCVLDADGDIATGQILINVFDDAPIAVDDNVTLPTNVDPVSGNVTDNDDSGADVDAHVTNVNFDGVDYPVVEGTPTVITTPYGELVINADGSYTYTPNGTNPDPVMEQFIYTYTDADGDSDTAVLTVNITADDQPIIISVDPLLVDETDMNPTDTDSGVITADFGNDDPGTFAGDGTFDLGGLTSDGQPITVTFDAATGTYTGTAGGNLIFTFTINADGTYNFELFGAVDHPDPTDPNDAVVINFGVVATDADGDSANGTVTVTILDDGPTVSPMQVVPVVDETDLGNGVVQANGNVNFDFGQDGAGTVEGNGGFSVQEVPNLTSGGIPVDVTYDAATGTYTGTAGGNVIFTLALDTQTGEYVFTLVGTLDHPDPTDPNDALNLEFGITVTDGDGDTVDGTITVTVLDDGPVITTPAAVSVDESHFDGSSGISTTGNIGIDYGADGEGEFSGTDDIIITTVGPGPSTTLDSLTSGGQPVTISFDANTNSYVGTTANGVTVFELVLNAQTGEFEFIQYVPIDHPDTASGNDAIMLSFGVNATDGDGDPIQTSIDVTIYDDGPQVFSNGPVVIDETDMSGPVGASVSDQISIEFGADGPGSVEGVADGFSYSVPGPTGPGGFTLTSGGVPVQVSYSDAIGGYIGTANGQTVFTLELNSDGTYTFTLLDTLDHPDTTDINDVINLSFQVVATDGDGDSATTTIEVAVYDDGPELVAAASVSIDETDMSGPVGASVSDTLNIDFGQDGPGSVEGTADGFSYSSPTPTGPAGFTLMSGGEPVSVTFDTASGSYIGTAGGQTVFTLELNADGSYTFTLLGTLDHPNHANPNDVINLAFDVVVTDGDGDMVTTTIDVAVYDDGPQLAPG